ncbi:MAG TPA: histidine--tRNA ligase [Chthonomonas sp.]|uniref:histidine--tRNA ligase n=1 Tax=Chthonomonas sp. TaxID=2282153 RepID=UPI002B4AC3DF|nr:histidine--tRNA ligase [Chthonomonas sp.]HLH81241.1 histidine--tRNA ligase [Chthonomonas sp.]
MKYKAPPYMYDVLPYPPAQEPWLYSAKWRYVERTFQNLCRRYGYREIRTPILEQTELFTRSIGETTDIVSKEMFTFTDRGGRSLTLKPEGTAPVVRACIEHGLFAQYPLLKLYYTSQNFRYERGQKGRYRQHEQLGVEVFGSIDPAIDAEVITLAMDFYRALGIAELALHIHTVGTPEARARYLEALRNYVRPYLSQMSQEAQRRFELNPLRMLDTKDPKEKEILAEAPKLLDHLDAQSRDHFERLQEYLKALETSFVVDPMLVRGFDYYTGTVFEVKGKGLGAQDALCGGGRYDRLVEECGGPPTPGIGFGLGVERCLLTLEALSISLPIEPENPEIFLVLLGDSGHLRPIAVRLLHDLRAAGICADMDYQGRNFKKQLKRADDLGAPYTLLIGEDELARGVVALRNQTTREQQELPLHNVVAHIKERLEQG